jgi:tetratricopeptide (TPR) repeat protein
VRAGIRTLAWAKRRFLLAILGLAVASVAGLEVFNWPERHLQTAHTALENREYGSARAALVRYLESRPKSAEAHLLLAQLDRRANRYAEAAQHLDASQRHGGPADVIELERALGKIQDGSYNSQLLAVCYRYLDRHVNDADQYLVLEALSQGFTKTYRLREAMGCLERMLILQPDNSYALRRRGWIYAQDERHDEAEADYRRALAIDPEDAVARLALAQMLLDLRKRAAEAADHFERLWKVQQDSPVMLGLARSWRLLGRGAEARRLLDDWLAGHPRDALALADRGRLALDEGSRAEAEPLLRQAVALAPYLIDANYSLYLCLSQQGHTAEAQACQERVRLSRKAREDLTLLTRRLQAAPDDADLRCQIALIFLGFGDEAEGVRWLSTTLQTQPNHAPSHRALADYFEKQGQSARAAEHRRLAGTTR